MQGDSKDFFLNDQNLYTEENSTDIKLFITRDNDEEKCNKETEEAEDTEEPVYNVLNYSKVVNQIIQLALFTLQKDDVGGFNLLKAAEII